MGEYTGRTMPTVTMLGVVWRFTTVRRVTAWEPAGTVACFSGRVHGGHGQGWEGRRWLSKYNVFFLATAWERRVGGAAGQGLGRMEV